MLKNIRLHIEQDEQKQQQLEKQAAEVVSSRLHANLNAFQRYIPSLAQLLNQEASHNIALLCNKDGQFNIVDYGLGRVFYGFDPHTEVLNQVNYYQQRPLYLDFTSSQEPDKKYVKPAGLPQQLECIVILGLGLGWHLQQLLTQHQIKHVLIYEPEVQYFSCSGLILDWQKILKQAHAAGTNLYLQIGKDGRDLVRDVKELQAHFTVAGAYIYQHYHHPVFDDLQAQIRSKNWAKLYEEGLQFSSGNQPSTFLPVWPTPMDVKCLSSSDLPESRLQKNLRAFEQYFPSVYQEFVNYKPVAWFPKVNERAEINILHQQTQTNWYGESPKQEAELLYESYSSQPNKDGLVLGYEGQKLKHYLHYQFVRVTQELLGDLHEEQGSLPENIKSLILFGLGSGYQLERLLEQHKVEKLFVCEPNRDFFYASLYAIDWAEILEILDKSGARLYINIGDDGSNLFRDLLSQFYSIGPYILNNTYFFQSYYNARLNTAIAQLREQLQIVISMGEYFDHAKYGISHTWAGVRRGYKHLIKQPANVFSHEDKNIPIFLVGNGPSLDYAVEHIQALSGRAIVISCGTSLQALYKNGIKPDFHAEIEQNRSTYDWAARIDNRDYLKSISLLSCNGVHPDTAELYKEVLLAFKEGESSTVSTLKVLGEANYEVLKFAFPTVTNFVLNLVLKLGFEQIYLFGTDFGFVDNTKHHSSDSGYYLDGKQLYDYAAAANTALRVPGNFRAQVSTKQEFKIAKMIMEQSLREHPQTDCFNTSDGALIVGAKPLKITDLLVVSTPCAKQYCIANWSENAFVGINTDKFNQARESCFSDDALAEGFSQLQTLVGQAINKQISLERLVEQQKNLLFFSYQHQPSLLFYYLYGTVNYANAVFTKMANLDVTQGKVVSAVNSALGEWELTLKKIRSASLAFANDVDYSEAYATLRMDNWLKKNNKRYKIAVISDDSNVAKFIERLCDIYAMSCTVVDCQNTVRPMRCEHLLVFSRNMSEEDWQAIKRMTANISYQRVAISSFNILSSEQIDHLHQELHSAVYVQGIGNMLEQPVKLAQHQLLSLPEKYANWLFYLVFSAHQFGLILPKFEALDSDLEGVIDLDWQGCTEPFLNQLLYESYFYIAVPRLGQTLDCTKDALDNRLIHLDALPRASSMILVQRNKNEIAHYITQVEKLNIISDQYINQAKQLLGITHV